ncbi:zyxin, putative [Entamoeba dispar SAW760]|uniref:Zyxin, putative n=1 Tax=Entamoeba dispar (strain ATCC PRA-260 / SAW760) TaxID=370354 RepID=B0ETV0_ENTDS|nr:zyxin, putative [Entamoeba dispar SAW760]EDR22026.1 zyxin, putative [Entamoeba dispar SAW760]|eukprot:EDR22026.1 zyxin, putative [Entamoeba dispar SAW760]
MECLICGKSTEQTPSVVIENKTTFVHKGCFRCSVCGCRLDGYLIKNHDLCCVDCYQNRTVNETCQKCGKIITGKIARVDGKSWHPHCFICSICNKPIEGDFIEKDQQHICLKCHRNEIQMKPISPSQDSTNSSTELNTFSVRTETGDEKNETQ